MRGKLAFLIALLLVLGPFTSVSQIRTSSIEISRVSYLQTQLMVYQIIEPEINTSLVGYWADTVFGVAGSVVSQEELYTVTEGNATFEMHQTTGWMWYADYSKLWNVSVDPRLPTTDDCRGIADDFLTNNGLLPSGASFTGFGSTNGTAFNEETEETQSKILNYQVNYGFELGSYPVVGPGGQLSVFIGDGGEVIGLEWTYTELEAHDNFSMVNFETALSLSGISDYDLETHTLVYYWSWEDGHGFVMPMWEVTVTDSVGENQYQYLRYLPATAFSPTVEIISPTANSIIAEGDIVAFNCSVSSGTAPFTYTWVSDVSGALSSSQSFTTTSLTVVTRNDVSLPQTITVMVTDANDIESTASIVVTVVPRGIPWIGIETVTLLVLAIIGSAAIFSRRRKSKGLAIIFITLVAASFLLLPQTTAFQYTGNEKEVEPSGFRVDRSAGDDGIREVGIEWLTYPNGKYIPNAGPLAKKFYNKIGTFSGWNKEFNWGNSWAWEEDFKYQAATGGGTDHIWIDTVDIAMFSGHGGTTGFQFNTNYDDTWLHYSEASWGDGDLEWIALDACKCLRHTDTNSVFSRWGSALNGIQMILGFHTDANDVNDRGEKFAVNMGNGYTVKNAWFKAAKDSAGSSIWAAVLYPTKANNPWNPPTDCPSNDHLHGFGYVSSEPVPAKWWVWIAVQC